MNYCIVVGELGCLGYEKRVRDARLSLFNKYIMVLNVNGISIIKL